MSCLIFLSVYKKLLAILSFCMVNLGIKITKMYVLQLFERKTLWRLGLWLVATLKTTSRELIRLLLTTEKTSVTLNPKWKYQKVLGHSCRRLRLMLTGENERVSRPL